VDEGALSMQRLATVPLRRLALALIFVLVAGALSFPAAADTADGPDGPRTFRAKVTTNAGPSPSYTLTLTNTATGGKTLGSANVSIPGFTVTGEPAASRGTARLNVGTIELRDLGVSPGNKVDVTFTGAGIVGEPCPYQIDIDARQANDFKGTGNALSLFGPSPVLVPADCAPTAQRLEFSVQPDDAVKGQPVPGNDLDGSPPTVRLVGEGSVLTNANVTVRILRADDDDPSPKFVVGDALQASVTVQMSGGVAVFDGLRITPGGFGYKLRATSDDLILSVDSTSFNVYDDACAPPESCTSTVGQTGTFSATAAGTPGPDGGGLILNVGGAQPGVGECSVPADAKVTRIPPAGIVATGVGLTDKLLVLTLDRTYDKSVADNDGVAHYQVCARSSEPTSEFSEYTDRYSGDLVEVGDWGYLPDCRNSGDRPPCVLSRTKSQGGFPVITLRWGSKITLR
jgi:hypothetical protein